MNRLSGIHSALWFNITEIRCKSGVHGGNGVHGVHNHPALAVRVNAVNAVNAADESTSRVRGYSTVRSVQACGTVASMSGLSVFRRCALHASQMIALEVDRDNKICAV